MGILLSILKKLFICKLHLSLPATQRRVVCLSLCTSGGLAGEGKHPLLDNLSIETFSDLIDFDTNGQRRPTATLWPKMGILLTILKELFIYKLHLSLPAAQRRAYHSPQTAASQVKVSTIGLVI